MTASSNPADRREFRRSRVLYKGRLYRGSNPVDCLIVDLSAGGARISTEDPAHLTGLAGDKQEPSALMIDRFGIYQTEVMWSAGKSAGVRFVKRAAAPPAGAAIAA